MNPSHEVAKSLLEKAKGDRQAFQRLIADSSIPLWVMGFHAQQAVEKALKSVLAATSVEYPRTHNLSLLLGLIRLHNLPVPPDAEDIPQLTPFGITFRYDDTTPNDGNISFDRMWALGCLERTICWAESYITGGEFS